MTAENSRQDRIIVERLIGRLQIWRDQIFERLQLLSRCCTLPGEQYAADDGKVPMEPADYKRLLRESLDELDQKGEGPEIDLEACLRADERLRALLPDEKTLFAVYNEGWDLLELINAVFAPDEHEYLAMCEDVIADIVLIDRIVERLEIPD